MASAFGSGIECGMVTYSTEKGPTSTVPPSGISWIGTVALKPFSCSLARRKAAVKGVQ